MAKRASLGKWESGGIARFGLFLPVLIALGDILRVHRLARHGITIAKPPREIAVFAALRTERREIRLARFFANGAGFGGLHCDNICALGASSARAGLVSIRTSRPVRLANSSSHSGLSFALSAGWTVRRIAGPVPCALSATLKA